MSYQTSKSATQTIPGDLVIVASLAAALSLFIAGYTATRATIGQASTQATTTGTKEAQINVVGHEGTLWESVGRTAK